MRIVWTPEQCDKLRGMYNTCCVADIAAHFGCSVMNIYIQANKLGLKKAQKITGRPWSAEHEGMMFDLWPNKEEIARLVGRSVKTVSEHARLKGLKTGRTPKRNWTPEEDVLLRELYPVIGRKQTAIRMGIAEQHIKSRAKKIGLRAENHHWSASDIALLKERFQTCDRDELEALFNRSGFCIYARAYKSGLLKGKEYISKTSVKNWMNLSFRRRGMRNNLAEYSPILIELNRARIMLTRKLKEQ